MDGSLPQSEQPRTNLLDRILTIGQAIQQEVTTNPQQVYQLIVDSVCELTGADCAVLYPYHPSYGEFYDVENVAAAGLRHKLPIEKVSDKKRRLSARVHQQGEILHEDVEREDPQIHQKSSFIAREGIQALMGLSLKFGEDIVGILYVDYRKPHHFSDTEKQVIRLFGHQAAMAVSSLWARRRAQIRTETVTKLRTIGETLVAIKDPLSTLESLLQKIADSALEVLDADIVNLYRYDQNRAELIWPPLFAADQLHSTIPPQTKIDNKYVVKAIKSGKPQYILDAQKGRSVRQDRQPQVETPAQQSFVVRERIASFAVIPLVATGQKVGVMFVNYRTPQLFGPEQKDVIETFAAQATVAIQNARLFELERQKAETLQEIEETFEPETVIEKVLDELSKVIEFHSASIQLIQGDSRMQVGGRGFSLQDPLPPSYLSDVSRDPLISEIVQNRRPLVLSNVNSHRYWRRAPQTDQINSWIGAPLVFKDRVIGLLTLDHRQPGFYSQASVDAVASFAGRVAPAIHNSQLFTAYDRRVEALTVLNQVGRTLTAGLRLTEAEILTLISEQAAKLVEARQMYIALYNEGTETINFDLVIEDGQRIDTQDQKEYRPRKINRTASGKTDYVLLTRRAILHRTRAEEVAWYQQPGRRLYSGKFSASHLAVPMMAANKVTGVIAVYSWDQERAYDELDRQVLTSMASQAAIALDNARLHNRLEQRIKALSTLNEVGQELTAGLRLDEDQILKLIYEQTRKLTGTQDMYIALYDEATEMIRFELALIEEQEAKIKPRQADWKKRGKTEEVILTKKPMLHRTEQESLEWYKQPEHQEFIDKVSLSWMGVPMVVGEKVLGVIAAWDWTRENVYDEQDLQVLESMANQAAIALDNARLYARRAQDLKALNEISQALTAGSRLKAEDRLEQYEILELIYEQARRLTGANNVYIALYDETTEMIRFELVLEHSKQGKIEPRRVDWKKRGKTEEVILTKKPMLQRTKQESLEWYKQPEHQEFIDKVSLSWMGVPMVVGEKVLGVIAAWDWERENVYDEQDLQVLESMANQAAIALDNSRLYGSLDLRIGQIQTVQEITNAIRTYAELPELLQSILEVSLPRLNAQVGTIQLLDRTTNELVMEAVVGAIDQDQSTRISLDQGITGQAAREKESIYIPDTSQDERFLDYLGSMRSELAIPLLQEGDVIGVFNIEDPEPQAFDETTRELAQLIADQAAIVIQNALAREELIANRQLAALGIATAAIQHRINNTLNIINPNIIRLKRRVDQEDATIWEILDIIERNTKYTADYIQRIQEPLKDVTLQPVDISLSLRDACTQVLQQDQDLPGFGEMQVKYDVDDSLPPIEASLGQITEIFRNLIENSYKAMGERGGVLTLTSHRINDWLEVEIRDTGPGIPPEIQDKLFNKPVPSKQPGQTGQGSGLGLWLSALLLKRYGGEIRIRHTGPDGTTVMVRLPITPS